MWVMWQILKYENRKYKRKYFFYYLSSRMMVI